MRNSRIYFPVLPPPPPPLFQFTDYQYIKNKYRMIPNNGGIRMRDGRRPFLFPIRMYFRVRNRANRAKKHFRVDVYDWLSMKKKDVPSLT